MLVLNRLLRSGQRRQFTAIAVLMCILALFIYLLNTALEPLSAFEYKNTGLWDELHRQVKQIVTWRGNQESTLVHKRANLFLNTFDAFRNTSSPDHSFCTPELQNISFQLNGVDVHNLASLDVSIPLTLNARSTCDARFPGAGDYFETLLESDHFRARLPIFNRYNGRQTGTPLQLPAELAEIGKPLRLRIWRLFRNFEDFTIPNRTFADFTPGNPYSRQELLDTTFHLTNRRSYAGQVDPLSRALGKPYCRFEDFSLMDWSGGYWFRSQLSRNSWNYYPPQCKAWTFNMEEASQCLSGRWLIFLGDSTIEDMLRNVLWTLFGSHPSRTSPHKNGRRLPAPIPRRADYNLTHPKHPERWTRASHLFNGHYDHKENFLGMTSFRHKQQIDQHNKFFKSIRGADTFILTSGLHDSWVQQPPRNFSADFQYGWQYYMDKINEIKLASEHPVEVYYRFPNTPTTVLNFTQISPQNPSKVDTLSLLEKDYLYQWQEKTAGTNESIPLSFIDSYDMTYPWHFDTEMNEGSHYGRPWKRLVDDRLVQLFLTKFCHHIIPDNRR